MNLLKTSLDSAFDLAADLNNRSRDDEKKKKRKSKHTQ